MELRIFQEGFNFSQDGPGNRLVFHLQGCNLRCPWCSNPEGLEPVGGWTVSVEALARKAESSRMMFFDGGGVTLTGGEATMQLDAVKALCARLRAAGIGTAIETNGLSPRLPELFPLVDVLMVDCKHHDPDKHRAAVGAGNGEMFRNLRLAADYGLRPAVRIPLIGGFNAGAADAAAFARRFHELGVSDRITVELLPYHEFGRSKYEKLGLPYTMTDEARVSRETVRAFADVLLEAGIPVIRT